jgi:tryptophan synthase beta chain
MALIMQEVSTERYIDIPEEVRDVYKLWRPVAAVPGDAPREGARHARADLLQVRGRLARGLAQAEHRGAAGVLQRPGGCPKRLVTETGAGQWGSALAFACSPVRARVRGLAWSAAYDQKPYRKSMIETWGATIHSSPSELTEAGRRSSPTPRQPGQPRDRDQRGGRDRRPARRHEVRARQRAQPRPAAPDDHRRGGAPAVRQGGETPRRHRRLHRRRLELRAAVFPFLREKLAGKIDPRIVAVEPARARRSRRASTATTSATPRG